MSRETAAAVRPALGVPAGLAAMLASAAEHRLDSVPAEVLRAAAPFAVLLVRRAVLLSSVLAPPPDRIPTAASAIGLLATCCDAAVVAGDQGLAQLLDWACLAWTGSQHNGSFFVGRHLPEQVHTRLQARLDQARRPMLVATGNRVLQDRIRQLEESVERHCAIDRAFCRTLLVEPVAAVIAGLRGGPTNGGLFDQTGEELVTRANAAAQRQIPPNGRRWPLLVRAVEAVREQVRELLGIAGLLGAPAAPGSWVSLPGVSLPGVSLSGIDPALDAVLCAALLTDPDLAAPRTEDGDPVLVVHVRQALDAIDAAASPAAFRLASLAAATDVGTAASRAVLTPFHLLAERAGELLTRLPGESAGTVAELRELVADALVRGDLADARTAAELLESECGRIALSARADDLERAARRLADDELAARIRRCVKVARERGASGELDDAEGFLADGESAVASAGPATPARTRLEPAIDLGDQLRAAEDAGADGTWLSPLRRGLRAAESRAAEARPTAAPPRTHEQDEDAILRLRAGKLDQAGWREVIESDVAQGRLDRALARTEQVRPAARWAPGVLVRVLDTNEHGSLDDQQVPKLVELVRVSRDELALLALADLLVAQDRAAQALEVLAAAEDIAATAQLPRLWFARAGALRAAGRGPEADELLRRSRPPLPADTAAEPPGDPVPGTVPEGHWPARLVGTVANVALVRDGQRRLDNGDVAGAADCWGGAVRAQYTMVFPTALAALVASGRPEQALQLYADLADRLWIGAGAAWNLGCAYAATGRPSAAAACFEYYARVATRAYPPEQATALRALFDAVGRPLPTLARSFPALGAGPAAGGSPQVQQAVADADLHRDGRSFRLAGNAIRVALRTATPDRQHHLLAEIERLFAQLAEPDAMAAAELVRALASAGRAEQAWPAVLEWLERSGAAPSLLVPAVQLASDLDGADPDQARIRLLRELLESRLDGAGFELYLSLAKLADRQDDQEACHRYAARTLEINPTCTEAAQLHSGAKTTRTATDAALAALVTDLRRGPSDVLLDRLCADFGPLLDALRMDALHLLSADVEPDKNKYDLPAEELRGIEDALLAVGEGDWESAASHLRAALDRKPRHLGLASATAVAFIRIGRLDNARSVAQTVAYSDQGQDALARVAFAAGDYATAEVHLAELARRRLRPGQVLGPAGRAGLLLHFLDRPDEAARVLLDSARRRLPGVPHLHAALAAVLAHRHGDVELRAGAVRLLLASRLGGPAAVRWAIEQDSLEALNDPAAPQLRVADLAALVAHFDPDQRTRLRSFLKRKSYNHALRELALLEERAGRTTAAFDARWAMVQHASRDQLTILHELLRFCERVGYLDGYQRALDFKRALGQSVTPAEQRRLEEWSDSEDYRVEQLGRDIREVLYTIQRLDLTQDVAAICDPLARLSDVLIALTEGTSDEAAIREVSALWARIAEFITGQADGAEDAPDLTEPARAFATARPLQAALGSELAAEAVQTVSVRLYDEWERSARRSHEMDPVQLTVTAANRLPDGPAELIVRLTAQVPTSELQIQAGGASVAVQLRAGVALDVPLVIESAAEKIEVVLCYQGPVGPVRKFYPVQISARSPANAQLGCNFDPNTRAAKEMFVGRDTERAILRMSYEGLVDRPVTIWFLEGPREVGKTSLAYSLTRLEGAPGDWPVPYVLPVYLDGEGLDITERHLLEYIATAVVGGLADLADVGVAVPDVVAPPIRDAEHFRLWWSGIQRACTPRVGLLVIIDEFQELLSNLNNAGQDVLRSVIGALRALQQGGAFGLLLCGSCTLHTVRRWLVGTSLAREIESEPVGFLNERETKEVFKRGFSGTVHILPEAADEIWQLTGGYPNHIHLLGKEVIRRLLTEHRRLVTRDLVREVALLVGESDRTVEEIIKPDGETLSGIELLLGLMDPDDEGAIDPGAAERLSAEEQKQIDRYLALGLLRSEGNRLAWANRLVLSWLEKQGKRHRRTASHLRARHPCETALIDAGCSDFRCLRPEETYQVQRDGQLLVARRFVVEGSPVPAEALDLLHDRFHDYCLSPGPPGFPDYRGRVGEWLLFSYVPGTTLKDKLLQHQNSAEEPERVAGWIAGACDVLAQVAELWTLTHGDLRPANVVLSAGAVSVVGWGYGGIGGRPLPLVPRDRDYLSPQYLRRIADDTGGATPGDDVFALGVILYRFLHPSGAPPYLCDLHDVDRAADLPVPASVPVDNPGLIACLHQALALRDEDRYRNPAELATALRAAVPQLREPLDVADREVDQPAVTNPNIVNVSVSNLAQIGQHMTNDRSIHAGSITNSVVGYGNRVRDSLNAVQQSQADDEVKGLLVELAQQVEQLTTQLEPAAAAALIRDWDAFGAEASSPEPRQGSLARIGADLVRTASKVSGVAAPLIALVERVVDLF